MIKNDYKTKQREYILSFFQDNSNMFYAVKDIYNFLKNNKVNIGLTTIYRCIDVLLNENLLVEYLDGKQKIYGYFTCSCSDHYHLVCSSCGRVEHIECDEFSKISNHLKNEHAFYLDIKDNFLKGRCKKCYLKK